MQHPRQVLEDLGQRPKKRLGQNFLKESALAEELLEACGLNPQLGVLEIGPGLGAMTVGLAKRQPWVIAVETDGALVEYLSGQFAQMNHVKILYGDALQIDFDEILPDESYQVVANLPYNVATPILFRLIEARRRPEKICIMVQKEVAERLQASPGTKAYGRLSILPQNFYTLKALKKISGSRFFPPTPVDSAFIALEKRPQPVVDLSDEKIRARFEQVIAAIFSSRRKTLKNSLHRLPGSPDATAVLKELGIESNVRGEKLNLQEIAALTRGLLAAESAQA